MKLVKKTILKWWDKTVTSNGINMGLFNLSRFKVILFLDSPTGFQEDVMLYPPNCLHEGLAFKEEEDHTNEWKEDQNVFEVFSDKSL